MRKYGISILILSGVLWGCNKLEIEANTPDCIESKISDFNGAQTCDMGVNVKEYTFQGEIVYVFDPGNCGADMAAEVFDANCNRLGLLGGIAGNAEINGENFSSAVFERTIWEK